MGKSSNNNVKKPLRKGSSGARAAAAESGPFTPANAVWIFVGVAAMCCVSPTYRSLVLSPFGSVGQAVAGGAGNDAVAARARLKAAATTSKGKFDFDSKNWPYTEKNQPTVREVLKRAASLTHVGGRPINVTTLAKDKSGNPLVLLIDNFLDKDHADLMIQLAIEQGLERSTTTGEFVDGKFERPTDESRTSSNSWCFNECFRDPIVGEVDRMVEQVVARPKKNMEHYQLLHYEIGQQYMEHHDFIYDQALLSQGPRQFTFFIYLNDVEEGGETEFMRLGLKVKPKRGSAVLWPNVWFDDKREDNKRMHPMTMHAALPVTKGHKYSANKWVHQGDFLTPWTNGVSG